MPLDNSETRHVNWLFSFNDKVLTVCPSWFIIRIRHKLSDLILNVPLLGFGNIWIAWLRIVFFKMLVQGFTLWVICEVLLHKLVPVPVTE